MPETPPAPRRHEPPTLHGLAACLALLAIEARALNRPLAAHLIAAAADALQDTPATGRDQQGAVRHTDGACAELA